jgi:hypothetical protein
MVKNFQRVFQKLDAGVKLEGFIHTSTDSTVATEDTGKLATT